MATIDDINTQIGEVATGPQSATIGGDTVVAKNTAELIDAANHLANQDADAKAHLGIRFIKLQPPGAG